MIAKRSVVAMGNRLQLAAFCCTTFIKPMLIAGITTEQEALKCCSEEQPDFLFTSDDLSQGYALSLIRGVKEVSPSTRCLFFTERETVSVVRDAVNAGCDGVAFYSSIGLGAEGDFAPALVAMAEGNCYYPPEVRKAAGFAFQQIPDLSAREDEVLKALCLGLSNKAIAQRLVLSTETIKSYVSSIISKMGANDRLDAVVKAIRMGY